MGHLRDTKSDKQGWDVIALTDRIGVEVMFCLLASLIRGHVCTGLQSSAADRSGLHCTMMMILYTAPQLSLTRMLSTKHY